MYKALPGVLSIRGSDTSSTITPIILSGSSGDNDGGFRIELFGVDPTGGATVLFPNIVVSRSE